jgi:polysaccharide export outer membrane protein
MKYLVVMAVTLFLTSCNIIPGAHISQDASPNTLFGDEPIVEANIILITPALIREIASNQPERKIDPFFTSNSVINNEYNYLIGVGDVLTVTIWERPELTIPFGQFMDASIQGNIVNNDGTIFYPYVGKVLAQGKTVVGLREELTKKLSKYFENPQIDVKVAVFNSQKFYVTGAVNKPGTYPITNIPIHLLEAINQASGIGPDGDIYSVRITRDGTPIEVPIYDMLYGGNLSGNIIIKHGDVLHVAPDQQRRVFVMGEVKKPMAMYMPHKPLTLAQVIGEVGGINETRANGSGIYVIRQSDVPEIVNVFQLDITKAYTLGLADSFIVESRDIVYVSASSISRWNRLLTNLLPSLTSFSVFDRLLKN